MALLGMIVEINPFELPHGAKEKARDEISSKLNVIGFTTGKSCQAKLVAMNKVFNDEYAQH